MSEQKDADMSGEIISYHWDGMPAELKDQLKCKKVNFQGKQVLLRELIGESFEQNSPSPELLSKLIAERPFGNDEYSEQQFFDENMYIKRLLVRNRLSDFVTQAKKFKDRVFLTGIKEHELIEKGFQKSNIKVVTKENCTRWGPKILFLADRTEDAGVIFKIIGKKLKFIFKIHWIHYMENEFYYVTSVGNGKQQFKFVQDEVSEDELVNMSIESKTRVILIADKPGSGKSTILLKLSKIIKEKTPSTWVIMRSFNEIFSGYEKNKKLKNALTENDGEVFIDAFINCICKLDLVDKELLKVLIQKHLRVSIFLDGFDELASKHKSKAIRFVSRLRKYTGAQIWVTSQPINTRRLFASFKTLPYSLKSWSEKERCMYLCKLWCKLLSDCELSKAKYKVSQIIEATNRCQEVAISDLNLQLKNLLESDEVGNSSSFFEALKSDIFRDVATYLLKKAIFTKEFNFLGVPLYVYMVGNVLYNNNFVYVVCADSFILFTEFVKQKIEIFLREKCGLNYESVYCKEMARREEKRIIEMHKNIAKHLQSTRNDDYLSLLRRSDCECLNDIGLVTVKGGEFVFFNKIVEEYFLTTYMLDTYF